jgi:poly(A) polymerase
LCQGGYITGLPMQLEPESLSILAEVERFFDERQIEAYVVGGFVRDMLAGRTTADIDIAVSGDALKTAREMAEAVGGKYVLLDEANRIARVVLLQEKIPLRPGLDGTTVRVPAAKRWYVDLSTIDVDIQSDLSRRDFTIDAMAFNLKDFIKDKETLQIIDPFDGQADIKNRMIRVFDDTALESDPARLMRAVRLAAELDFSISAETEKLIKMHHTAISGVAGERVREELVRILNHPSAGKYLRYMDNTGLLTAIIPELEPSRGTTQPKEHHWDVLNHSLETVNAVDFLLRQGGWEYTPAEVLDMVPWSEKLSSHFSSEAGSGMVHSTLLKLAGLLHDIAKPETKILVKDRVRFFGHTEQGADKAVEVLERLRFSNKEIKLVETMVRYHLRPTQMSHEGLPTQRAIYRYFRDTGPAGIDILFLSLADHLAARGPDLEMDEWKWHAGQVNCILVDCFRRGGEAAPPKLIDGHDLINLFGMRPGPEIRDILEAVKEAQAAGEMTSREQALSYVKNRLLYREQNSPGSKVRK